MEHVTSLHYLESLPGDTPLHNASCGILIALGDTNGRSHNEGARPALAVGKRRSSAIDNMDDLLVAVGATQDRQAFQTLFEYFAPRMKSFLQSKGTSPELSEEAVQEALLNVWRKAAQFDPQKASALTWIFAIARNTRIDLLRKSNTGRLWTQMIQPLSRIHRKRHSIPSRSPKKRAASENMSRGYRSSSERSYVLRFLRSCLMRRLLAGSTSHSEP